MISRMSVPTPHSGKNKVLTNYRAAKLLGVSLPHLGQVLNGKRQSKRLLARYGKLKAEFEARAKAAEVKPL